MKRTKSPSSATSNSSRDSTMRDPSLSSLDNSESGLTRVCNRSNVAIWRSEGVVSDGGSFVLVERMQATRKKTRKTNNRKANLTAVERPGEDVSLLVKTNSLRGSLVLNQTKNDRLEYLNSFILDLDWAFTELGCGTRGEGYDWSDLESIGIFLNTCLSHESRLYHNVAHVYQISAGASPLQVLAAFFRDVVKDSLDKGTAVCESEQYRTELFEPGTHTIRSDLQERRDLIVARMFGHGPGSDLTKVSVGWHPKGTDMFLSALVAARVLKSIISLKLVAQLCACIEATIPFSSRPMEMLFQRLVRCNQEFDLGLSDQEMVFTIQQACDLWNREIGNMVCNDVTVFLDNTWSLLPENTRALQRRNLYTLGQYHAAMISMVGFLSQQMHNDVYLEFRGIPSASETRLFRKRFKVNCSVALSYVNARLLSVAVVAAMAIRTGGDGPKSYFFGDIPSLNQASVNLGELLTIPETSQSMMPSDVEVFDLLRYCETRFLDAGFDNRNTGVAAFLYGHLGQQEMTRFIPFAMAPMTVESSTKLLQSLPYHVVKPILEAFAFMAVTRAPAAERLKIELEEHLEKISANKQTMTLTDEAAADRTPNRQPGAFRRGVLRVITTIVRGRGPRHSMTMGNGTSADPQTQQEQQDGVPATAGRRGSMRQVMASMTKRNRVSRRHTMTSTMTQPQEL